MLKQLHTTKTKKEAIASFKKKAQAKALARKRKTKNRQVANILVVNLEHVEAMAPF